jgi:hypothetical protein
MLSTRLSFLNRATAPKQVCRICHEMAELKTAGLCADCAQIKARIRVHITQQPADGDSSRQTQRCNRFGCFCAPCGRRILDAHSFQPTDSAPADRREIHFHSRCHTLWLEAVEGSGRPSGPRLG